MTPPRDSYTVEELAGLKQLGRVLYGSAHRDKPPPPLQVDPIDAKQFGDDLLGGMVAEMAEGEWVWTSWRGWEQVGGVCATEVEAMEALCHAIEGWRS